MTAASDFALSLGSLVGYWPLGEASGDALDGSTNSNDGTVTIGAGARGEPALDKNGDGSVLFDSANTKVQIADAAPLQDPFDGGGSLFFIFDADSDGENDSGTILDKGFKWNIEVGGQTGSNIALLILWDFDGTNGLWQTAIDIPLNTPIVAVLTYDADAAGNNPILYLWDGTSLTTRIVGDGLTRTTPPVGTRVSDVGDDLIIGNRADQFLTFDGHEDEVMLFSAILTEVQSRKLIRLALEGAAGSYILHRRRRR